VALIGSSLLSRCIRWMITDNSFARMLTTLHVGEHAGHFPPLLGLQDIKSCRPKLSFYLRVAPFIYYRLSNYFSGHIYKLTSLPRLTPVYSHQYPLQGYRIPAVITTFYCVVGWVATLS